MLTWAETWCGGSGGAISIDILVADDGTSVVDVDGGGGGGSSSKMIVIQMEMS